MSKLHRLAMIVASGLAAGLLAGCITAFAPTRALPREALASVNEVAVAVDPAGNKHYAWTECSGQDATYTCVLVYSRVAPTGAVLYSYGFVQSIGDFALYPDVAVNSAGDAYVVWSECEDLSNCYDYWTVFPASHPENVEPQMELLHSSAVQSEDPPVVAGRGLDVYAAYFIIESGYVRLRYRQLNGGSSTGYIDSSTLSPVGVDLEIDSNGDLHAAWVRNPVTDTLAVYANNVASGGNFSNFSIFDDGANLTLTYPDLALEANNRAYFAYSINNGADDVIKVRCIDSAPDCYREVTTLIVPQAAGDWNVYRNVHLELIDDQPQVVFAATNPSETYYEVWWYRPPVSGGDVAPAAVTDTNTTNEGEPLIVREHSTAGDVPVVGWREFQELILDGQGPAGNNGHCAGDVWVTYSGVDNTSRVFTDRGTCANSGLDLAVNGPWVAGVWVDEESDAISSFAAWTSFNANLAYVPLVSK